jgi:hypothetical protein
MTQRRASEDRTNMHRHGTRGRAFRGKDPAPPAVAGRAAYREEFQPDYGPDLDESLDGTDTGRDLPVTRPAGVRTDSVSALRVWRSLRISM